MNGRPFRESSDSYNRTGIPCGNPRRYHSHEVVRMESTVRSRSVPISGPLETIETEGQKQLQALLQKQLDTKVTLKQQLGQKREFSRGSEYQASTVELTGTLTLADFRLYGDVDLYIEEMKGYGLTHAEILFKMQAENVEAMAKKGKLANVEYDEARLKEIEDKIAEKKRLLAQPDQFSDVKSISRHEMEIERAVAAANPHNKFLHQTLIKGKKPAISSNISDPINDLPDILDKITKTKHTEVKHRHHRRKDNSYKSECKLECCVTVEGSYCSDCESHNVQSLATSSCDQSCDHKQAVATCAEKPPDYISPSTETENQTKQNKKKLEKSTAFTVQTSKTTTQKVSAVTDATMIIPGEEIRILDHIEGIPEEAIRRYKLSTDEIAQLPRFDSYTPGEPSNVLFLKNLSPKVTEEDLASLFINFQEDDNCRIIFKLCTGRMKGQAFVTFKDEQTATAALELVHGYDFKGKPVIIQYGKKVA